MKLTNAYVCVSCDEIFSHRMSCPSCASTVVVPLERWIFQEEEVQTKKTDIMRLLQLAIHQIPSDCPYELYCRKTKCPFCHYIWDLKSCTFCIGCRLLEWSKNEKI